MGLTSVMGQTAQQASTYQKMTETQRFAEQRRLETQLAQTEPGSTEAQRIEAQLAMLTDTQTNAIRQAGGEEPIGVQLRSPGVESGARRLFQEF